APLKMGGLPQLYRHKLPRHGSGGRFVRLRRVRLLHFQASAPIVQAGHRQTLALGVSFGADALTLNCVQVCFPPCLSRSMAHRHSRFSCFHAEPIRCLSEVPSTMMGEMYRSLRITACESWLSAVGTV